MKESYFGSVRFFKNLILLAVIAGIAAPTILAVRWHGDLTDAESELRQLSQQVPVEPLADLSDPIQVPAGSRPDFAAEVPPYQALYPDFYAPQALTADEHTDKTAFLTFDDGPSSNTAEILDVLAEYDVKATFFIVGKSDETNLQRIRDITDAGHSLGMHSYTHEYKDIYSSPEAFLDDMYKVFTLIQDATGTAPTLFRFPGGSINAYNYGVYREIMAEMLRRGFVPCDWNVSSGDAGGGSLSVNEILHNVLDTTAHVNRAFVLMHDSPERDSTVRALDDVIEGMRDQGYTFEALTPQTRPVLFSYPN